MKVLHRLGTIANKFDNGGLHKSASIVDDMIKVLAAGLDGDFTDTEVQDPLVMMYDKIGDLLNSLGATAPKGYGDDIKFLRALHDSLADKLDKPKIKAPKSSRKSKKSITPSGPSMETPADVVMPETTPFVEETPSMETPADVVMPSAVPEYEVGDEDVVPWPKRNMGPVGTRTDKFDPMGTSAVDSDFDVNKYKPVGTKAQEPSAFERMKNLFR